MDYWHWAQYQTEIDPLPFQFELFVVAAALLIAGLLSLWFLRRFGLYLFAAGLVLKLYVTFPHVPAILSGVTLVSEALSYALAGFILATGMHGGILMTMSGRGDR